MEYNFSRYNKKEVAEYGILGHHGQTESHIFDSNKTAHVVRQAYDINFDCDFRSTEWKWNSVGL